MNPSGGGRAGVPVLFLMSGIAFITSHETEQSVILAGRLLSAMPAREHDGGRSIESARGATLGYCYRRSYVTRPEIHRDPSACLTTLFDGCLYNAKELRDRVGANPRVGHAALVTAAYRKFGEEVAAHLAGDFVFVIWNEVEQSAYASRDAFGVRPLFYTTLRGRLAACSEVHPLVEASLASKRLDDGVILDYLSGSFVHSRETFFEDVRRLRPGHYMVWKAGATRETRYFVPPTTSASSSGQEHQAFSELMRQAVADRLDTSRGTVIELSGGLDSSAIACLADEIVGADPAKRSRVCAASAVFPGLSCDESEFIEAVSQQVAFRCERFDGRHTEPGDESQTRSHPWRFFQPGLFGGIHRVAQKHRARVVISGQGGDELLQERGAFRQLASQGRALRLLRETRAASQYTASSWLFWLTDALRALVPAGWAQATRSIRTRRRVPPLAWLGPRTKRLWHRPQELAEPIATDNHVTKGTWNLLTRPMLTWWIECSEQWCMERQLEARYPFLDIRLARFVLQIPPAMRMPEGRSKILLRKAMGNRYPPAVRKRAGKAVFNDNAIRHIRDSLPTIRGVLDTCDWASSAYVDRGEARRLLTRLATTQNHTTTWSHWRQLWDIANLEIWLRRDSGLC